MKTPLPHGCKGKKGISISLSSLSGSVNCSALSLGNFSRAIVSKINSSSHHNMMKFSIQNAIIHSKGFLYNLPLMMARLNINNKSAPCFRICMKSGSYVHPAMYS